MSSLKVRPDAINAPYVHISYQRRGREVHKLIRCNAHFLELRGWGRFDYDPHGRDAVQVKPYTGDPICEICLFLAQAGVK